MTKLATKRQKRDRRRARVRAKVFGTKARPRLNVKRSLSSIFVQLIDDENSKTLASVHSKNVKSKEKGKTAVAFAVGKALAEKAKELKISKVVFDRAGYKYHGRVKAVADGARDGGLIF